MAKSITTHPNHETVAWARETSGHSLESAAKRLGISLDRLEQIENGDHFPTLRQLKNMSNVYKRPLATFYLSAPPDSDVPEAPDFRLRGTSPLGQYSPKMVLELRRAARRREIALELLQDGMEFQPATRPSASLDDSPESTAQLIRDWLGISIADQPTTLRGWVNALESSQILYFQVSGAHTVAPNEMLAFSLAEFPLPVIVVNGKDLEGGRIFSIAHELCHIVLNFQGVCLPGDTPSGDTSSENIERYCDKTAAALLMPRHAFLSNPLFESATAGTRWSDGDIEEFAKIFGINRPPVILRLIEFNKADWEFYFTKKQQYESEYLESRRSRSSDRQGFAPPWTLAVSRNGRFFSGLVLNALNTERLSYSDASEVLNLRVKHFDRLNTLTGGVPLTV